jgi:ribA/ribD-fused uncharacterized protein
MIEKFSGPHRFLSNFYPCTIIYGGITYPSVENAYQACKSDDLVVRGIFGKISAKEAKRLGRNIVMSIYFEGRKLELMEQLLWQKFSYPPLKELLLNTGDEELVEGNDWGDRFWGVDGNGENHLGKILMKIRKTFKEAENAGTL